LKFGKIEFPAYDLDIDCLRCKSPKHISEPFV